jgi:hypothetical protein
MPLGLSWYSACCRVIFSEAAAGDIRDRSPAGSAAASVRIKLRRDVFIVMLARRMSEA